MSSAFWVLRDSSRTRFYEKFCFGKCRVNQIFDFTLREISLCGIQFSFQIKNRIRLPVLIKNQTWLTKITDSNFSQRHRSLKNFHRTTFQGFPHTQEKISLKNALKNRWRSWICFQDNIQMEKVDCDSLSEAHYRAVISFPFPLFQHELMRFYSSCFTFTVWMEWIEGKCYFLFNFPLRFISARHFLIIICYNIFFCVEVYDCWKIFSSFLG